MPSKTTLVSEKDEKKKNKKDVKPTKEVKDVKEVTEEENKENAEKMMEAAVEKVVITTFVEKEGILNAEEEANLKTQADAIEAAEREKARVESANLEALGIRQSIKLKIIDIQRLDQAIVILSEEFDKCVANNEEAAKLAALAEEESDEGEDTLNDDSDDEDGATKEEGQGKVKTTEGNQVDEDGEADALEGKNAKAPQVARPIPPQITSEEDLEKTKWMLIELRTKVESLQEQVNLLQNEYELTIGETYKATSIEVGEIVLTNFFYVLTEKRNDKYLSSFYRNNSSLNIEGRHEAIGTKFISNAIVSSFEKLKLEICIESFDFDSSPPSRCSVFVTSRYNLKINNDKPQRVIEIFELDYDDENSMYIKRQYFISKGMQPIYIWPALPLQPVKPPVRWPENNLAWSSDLKFRDNREPMLKEREVMSTEDTDCPFQADYRTVEEIAVAAAYKAATAAATAADATASGGLGLLGEGSSPEVEDAKTADSKETSATHELASTISLTKVFGGIGSMFGSKDDKGKAEAKTFGFGGLFGSKATSNDELKSKGTDEKVMEKAFFAGLGWGKK